MSTRLINTRKNYQTYTKTVTGDDGLVIPFENVCTGHVGVVHIICDGVTNINALPFQETVYIEISADTDLSSSGLGIDGNKINVVNTDTSAHTITFPSSISESIAPGESFKAEYADGTIIVDHLTRTRTAASTYSPSHKFNTCILDTSSSGFTTILSDPIFIGQEFLFICDGTNLAEISHSDFYVNNIILSDGFSISGKSYYDGTSLHWAINDVQTAKYSSGNFTINLFSCGKTIMEEREAISVTTNSATGSIYRYSKPDIVYPIPLSTVESCSFNCEPDDTTTYVWMSGTATTTSFIRRRVMGTTITSISNRQISIVTGEYA